jgi:hypothetical protein
MGKQLYLDEQPEIQQVLRQWMQSLELDTEDIAHGGLEVTELECRSRDGFIRASHNFGGFDAVLMSDVEICYGSGGGPNLAEIDRQIKQAETESIQWFKDQQFIGLEHLKDDEITYTNLYKLGRGDLAEQLSETERDWMRSPVWWGVRAMYEGINNRGHHVIMLYVSGNVNEYYGAFGKDSETLGKYEVRFRTASGLRRQLQRLRKKIENAF